MKIQNYLPQSLPRRVGVVGLVFVLVSSVFISHVGAASDDQAHDGRLVTVHDRGQERVVLTHAQSVRDALKDAGVTVAQEDMIEPALDSQLVATDYTVNIYRARPVIVVDGSVRQKIMTAAQTPEGIAQAAGITMQKEDKSQLGSNTNTLVTDGASVALTIDRATSFTFNLYGTVTTAYTQAQTVGEMLDSKRIYLQKDDSLSVERNASITEGMEVSLWRNGVQTATVEELIAFSVRQIKDADQPTSYRKVQTPGIQGKKSATYEIIMQNGKEVSRKLIQSVTLQEPIEQIEIVGAKPSFGGDFAAALAKLRQCESGGNYANKNNSLYRGAYQFGYQTWAKNGGYHDPADAPPALQDAAARALYERRGWQPWPACSKKLQLPDIYR